jgi:hypothetical protein
MLLRTWRFLTIILVSLSMAMAFCHLLQLPPRMSYDSAQWVATQSLYQLFGTVGAFIEVSAVLLAAVLSLAVCRRRPAFRWTLFGAACLLVAHAAWWVFVAPVNAEISTWTPDAIPGDWTWWRSQWEYTHAARAILEILGLSALVLSVLVETPTHRLRDRAMLAPGASQMSAPHVDSTHDPSREMVAGKDRHVFTM